MSAVARAVSRRAIVASELIKCSTRLSLPLRPPARTYSTSGRTPVSGATVGARRLPFASLGLAAFTALAISTYAFTTHSEADQRVSNVGVHAWGFNGSGVVAPGAKAEAVKYPKRISFFDDMELRDLVLGDDVGVAVTCNGDVVVWGAGYAPGLVAPEYVLKGKNIRQVKVSQHKIYALPDSGDKIYALPVSKKEQQKALRSYESRHWYFSLFASFSEAHAFTAISVPLNSFERVKQMAAGAQHILLLTSKGRVFSALTGDSPVSQTDGQLGVPLLLDGEDIAPEQVHEIVSLRGFNIVQIAAGENHSLVRDATGAVWAFGSNSHGQLGIDYTIETAFMPIPARISLDRLYNRQGFADIVCEYIAAGGDTSFFSVRNRKKDDVDLWVSGAGLHGQHGTGRYLHMQGTPIRVRSLSGIKEYVGDSSVYREIPVRYISVGRRQIAAVLDNAVGTDVGGMQRQLVLWGGNDWFQLGNGRRSNLAKPEHMQVYLSSSEKKKLSEEDEIIATNQRKQLSVGKTKRSGRKVEETVVCGSFGTALYWKCI
ncbi:regulator of chromosome condensation 1/beta-lactamase-inhibitor protein II [Limtongia smithiae]|uniref:regulator of chromosome condensation 1/beta-lactamase-inhibitor protein II n=1 Tax=Limtongia smithiae TaxID=1125753 RepID=UPI0034CE62A9